eukprot:354698-Amphidinium_carterae.1
MTPGVSSCAASGASPQGGILGRVCWGGTLSRAIPMSYHPPVWPLAFRAPSSRRARPGVCIALYH